MQVRDAVRHAITASVTFSAATYGMLALNTRTATRLALFAAETFPAHSANVAVLQRIPVRHEITLHPIAFGAQTSTVAVESRDARNIELMGGGVFPAHTVYRGCEFAGRAASGNTGK